MKRLTDGMRNEMLTIAHRANSFHNEFVLKVPAEQRSFALSCLNSQHGDELETYKVRLENLYSETDVKEQTFQDFQTYFWNLRGFSGDFYLMEYSLSIKKRIWNVFQKEKLCLLGILDQIATLQDKNSDDRERYLKMGLRLDPNCANMNYRNEKDANYPFTHRKHFG